VFDVESRKLLFRAPGMDKITRFSSAVGASNQTRISSQDGFENAVAQMSENLDRELSQFKERVEVEKIARVEVRQGYSGAGSSDFMLLLFMLVPLALRAAARGPGRQATGKTGV